MNQKLITLQGAMEIEREKAQTYNLLGNCWSNKLETCLAMCKYSLPLSLSVCKILASNF